MFTTRVLILTFAAFVTIVVALKAPAEIRYGWKYMNFTWESTKQYQTAVANGDYVPKHTLIAGIKMWKDQLYLTIPRLIPGVPATLVTIPLNPVAGNRSPNVKPYPNWQMQKVGDCNAFQFVQGMEIDPKGRMWVLDTGRQGPLEDMKAQCPPRLVILDLNNKGKTLLNYQFPKNVVNASTGFLNDIVLDETDGGYAYIANPDRKTPSIVVFSLRQRKSWSVTHPSMYSTAPKFQVKGDYPVLRDPFNVNSIALTAASKVGERQFYYAPLTSYEVFCVPNNALKGDPRNFASYVTSLGKKPSQTDGMMVDASGELYFGLLTDNQVCRWNRTNFPLTDHEERVFEDNVNLMWQDTFAIDDTMNLWVTSNKIQRVRLDDIDISKVNFRVVRLAQIGYLSYQYNKNGTAPKLPRI